MLLSYAFIHTHCVAFHASHTSNPLNNLSVARFNPRLSFPQWDIRNIATFTPGQTLSVNLGPILAGNAELTGPGTLNRIDHSQDGKRMAALTGDTVVHHFYVPADPDPSVFQVSTVCPDKKTWRRFFFGRRTIIVTK